MKNQSSKTNPSKSKSGFTLVEVMLVVVIIGIIVGLAVPKITGNLGKAQHVAARATLKSIEGAIGSYEMDNLRLPDSLDDLIKQKNGNGPYLTASKLIDPWSHKYKYSKPGSHNLGYDISTTSPDGDEFNNWD